MTAYRFIQANRGTCTVREMTGLLGLSAGACCRRAKYGLSTRRREADAALPRLIRETAARRRRRCGSPRMRAELRLKYGKRVSLKKAARLMRENHLNARPRRSFTQTANPQHGLPVCENLLNRGFSACRGGQKRVSGITYLRSAAGFVYLTAVPALLMAFTSRPAQEGLLFRSGWGVQYCAQSFRTALHARCPTVRRSMSRKGNCRDNAAAESFFKTLKRELETLDGNHSAAEVRQSVFLYIEAYYNRIRLHSALDYLAPDIMPKNKT